MVINDNFVYVFLLIYQWFKFIFNWEGSLSGSVQQNEGGINIAFVLAWRHLMSTYDVKSINTFLYELLLFIKLFFDMVDLGPWLLSWNFKTSYIVHCPFWKIWKLTGLKLFDLCDLKIILYSLFSYHRGSKLHN